MNTQMVTTNLRLPYEDWLQIKTLAAEEGASFNEYAGAALQFITKAKAMAMDVFNKNPQSDSIWSLSSLAKIKNHPVGGLSEEDEIIYGV